MSDRKQNAIAHLEYQLENTYSSIQYIAVFDRDKVLTETPPYSRAHEVMTIVQDPETKEYLVDDTNEYRGHPHATSSKKEEDKGEFLYLGFPNAVSKADFSYGTNTNDPTAYTLFEGYGQRHESENRNGGYYTTINKHWIEVKMASYSWWDEYNSLLALLFLLV